LTSELIFQANQYQITNLLSENSIVPSLTSQYNASIISEIITDSVGAIPSIGCESDRVNTFTTSGCTTHVLIILQETGLTYLAEIRICFHRNLTLIDCKHHSSEKLLPPLQSVGDCPTHRLIFYPSDVSSDSVQWLKRKYSQKRKLDKQKRLKEKSLEQIL